ncbi:hypothetical protein B7463_g5075, partial [Scytalidium lignicola]
MSESPVLPNYASDQWNDFKFDLEDRDISPETSLSSFEDSPVEASWDYFPYDGFNQDSNFSDPLFGGKDAIASEEFTNIPPEVKKEPCLSPSALLDLSWSQDAPLPSAEGQTDFTLPLSNEEQANLLAIAMGRNNDFTLPLSPMSSYPTAGSVSSISSRSPSPQPRTKPAPQTATKRPSTRDGAPAPKTRKCSHNAIEKRYRMNLNERILALQNSLPALRASPLSSSEEEMGVCRRKRSKAAILTGAIEYIAALEKKNKRLSQQLGMMQAQWKPRV